MKNKHCVTLIIILLLALAVRLWGISARLPYITHPDEPRYINIVQNMVRTGDFNPHFFRYPTLFFYIQALAYVPYLVVAQLAGVIQDPSTFESITTIAMGSTKVPHPTMITMQRAVTAMFGSGLVWLTYAVASRLTNKRRVALTAALITALSSQHVINARFITPDTYVTVFAMATLLLALLIYEKGHTWHYLLGGLLVGLTASSKYNGVLVAVTIAAAHFLRNGWQGLRDWRIYVAGLSSVAGFFMGTPYALIDRAFFIKELRIVGKHYSTGHHGMEGQTLRWYLNYLWEYSSFIAPLALVGMARAIIKREKAALIVAAFPVAYFIFIARFPVRNSRTILPMVAMLTLLGVWTLEWLYVQARGIKAQTWRALATVGLAIMLAFSITIPLYYTGISGYVIQSTTSYGIQATTGWDTSLAWLQDNLPPGAKVAVESYVPFIDPQAYSIVSHNRMIVQPAVWYIEQGCDYALFSEGMFGRYLNNPQAYPNEVAAYEALFTAFEHVRTFDEGGYTVYVYRVR